jgi:hypothetical protein
MAQEGLATLGIELPMRIAAMDLCHRKGFLYLPAEETSRP